MADSVGQRAATQEVWKRIKVSQEKACIDYKNLQDVREANTKGVNAKIVDIIKASTHGKKEEVQKELEALTKYKKHDEKRK